MIDKEKPILEKPPADGIDRSKLSDGKIEEKPKLRAVFILSLNLKRKIDNQSLVKNLLVSLLMIRIFSRVVNLNKASCNKANYNKAN